MLDFVTGMNSALAAVAALVFFKFWIRGRDRLFLLFGVAFLILAADWTALAVLRFFTPRSTEHNTLVYSVRLLAFSLMLAAIIDKNRRRPKSAGDAERSSEQGSSKGGPHD